MNEVRFVCEGCGTAVRTYRWFNLRTIPPSMDNRDLCDRCKKQEKQMIGDKPTCAVCDKGKYGCRCADVPKSTHLYSDDQARAAIYELRPYVSGFPTNYSAAAQRLITYVAERLPKKMKWVRSIDWHMEGFYATRSGCVDDDPAKIGDRVEELIREGAKGVTVGPSVEIVDDQ